MFCNSQSRPELYTLADSGLSAVEWLFRVAYGDGTLDARMDERMYLITPDTLINQTTMSKWGIDVGEIVLVIQKR